VSRPKSGRLVPGLLLLASTHAASSSIASVQVALMPGTSLREWVSGYTVILHVVYVS
jgi:hypothetical protein